MKHSKTLSLSLLALGLIFGCQQKSDNNSNNNQPTTMAGSGPTAGSSSTSGTPDAGGSGGAPDEEVVRKGQRGSSCNSTNDCEDGLSCMVTGGCPTGVACANKSCQPSNFEDLTGTGNSMCGMGKCEGYSSYNTANKCTTNTDCTANTCVTSTSGSSTIKTCSLSGVDCSVTA